MTEPQIDLFAVFRQAAQQQEQLVETQPAPMTVVPQQSFAAPQVPTAKQWSWNSKTVTYAALVAVGVALSVWFAMAYSKWSKEGSHGHSHGDSGSGDSGAGANGS